MIHMQTFTSFLSRDVDGLFETSASEYVQIFNSVDSNCTFSLILI